MTGGVRVLGEGPPEDASAGAPEGGRDASSDRVADGTPDESAPGAPGADGADRADGAAAADDRPRVALAVVALVALLGVVGTAVFGLKWNTLRHRQDAEHQAEGVARQFLTALTNFDARTVDADFGRILSFAADNSDFAHQAQSTFNSDLNQALKAKQASTRGEIHYLFVQGVRGGRADVYAVVDLTTFNNSLKAPSVDEMRVDVTLQRLKGLWRVSELTVLQAPPVAGTPLTGPTSTTVP